jgi:hypothetical protein
MTPLLVPPRQRPPLFIIKGRLPKMASNLLVLSRSTATSTTIIGGGGWVDRHISASLSVAACVHENEQNFDGICEQSQHTTI